MKELIFEPVNPSAQQGVRNVMKYLAAISGKKVVTGQHTQTLLQEELSLIREVTGKEPALLGFELLSYSPNINYSDTDDECMKEVHENYGMLSRAWDWAEKKGLVTFTWHWFSPLGGRSKSFFTVNTDFDAAKAAAKGSDEYRALISDLDVMAGYLRPFCDKGVPILWRPFHEGEGDWFWWAAKGPEPLKALWRIMFERFTKVHHLDNLIWVWTAQYSAGKEQEMTADYPGNDCVDILGVDIYPEAGDDSSHKDAYVAVRNMGKSLKPVALAEVGYLPDPDKCLQEGANWSYFTLWYTYDQHKKGEEADGFGNTPTHLKAVFTVPSVLNRARLPGW